MRVREEIEREMFNAREDLEERLTELRHLVQEKLAVTARAQHAVEERVDRVRDAARRGLERARQHRAVLLGVLLGGVVALTLTAVLLLRRRHRHFT